MSRFANFVHHRAPSLPPVDWERPAPTASGLRRDIFAALGFFLLALLMQEMMLSLSEQGEATERPLAFAGLAALVLPLLFRRRWPILMMLFSSAAFLLLGSAGTADVAAALCSQIAYFLAIYTAVAWAQNRRMLWTALGLVLLSMGAWLLLSFFTADLFNAVGLPLLENSMGVVPAQTALPIYSFLMNILYFGGAIFLGMTGWSNSYATLLVAEQAKRLAEQADELAEHAVSEERLRIARELHDVIAHHISSVGVQASAARLVQPRDPAQAIELMRGIESSARNAVSETRSLLGVLRERGTPDARPEEGQGTNRDPEPSLAQLNALIEHNAAHGLRVQLSIAEHRQGYLQALPKGLSLAMYRISSEALANVRNHSTARSAVLSLRSGTEAGASWVEVEVTDEGSARAGSSGSGFGLRGIRERAKLHHGSAEIGPRTPRGWRTRARLRVTGEAATRLES